MVTSFSWHHGYKSVSMFSGTQHKRFQTIGFSGKKSVMQRSRDQPMCAHHPSCSTCLYRSTGRLKVVTRGNPSDKVCETPNTSSADCAFFKTLLSFFTLVQ